MRPNTLEKVAGMAKGRVRVAGYASLVKSATRTLLNANGKEVLCVSGPDREQRGEGAVTSLLLLNKPHAVVFAAAKIGGILADDTLLKDFSLKQPRPRDERDPSRRRAHISLMSCSLYGPNDNFDLRSSHALPALTRKFHEAELAYLPDVAVWGSGTPLWRVASRRGPRRRSGIMPRTMTGTSTSIAARVPM